MGPTGEWPCVTCAAHVAVSLLAFSFIFSLLWLRFVTKLLESSWLEELRYGHTNKVVSSNFSWDKFLLVGKKIPLAVLAIRPSSRVRIPAGTNLCLWVKEISLAVLAVRPGFEGFFRDRVKQRVRSTLLLHLYCKIYSAMAH